MNAIASLRKHVNDNIDDQTDLLKQVEKGQVYGSVKESLVVKATESTNRDTFKGEILLGTGRGEIKTFNTNEFKKQ